MLFPIWLRPWYLDLLAFGLGAISLLAFAPFHWYGLLPVSIAGLFGLVHAGSTLRATWRGWLFGAGAYGIGMIWLFAIAEHVAATDGVNPMVLAILGAILLLVMLAPLLIAGLYRLLCRVLPAVVGWRHALGFAYVWVVIEWLRSWLFSGFPLLQPGYAWVETPLSAWAPLGSVLAVTFVLVLLSCLLVLVLRPGVCKAQRLGCAGAMFGLVAFSLVLEPVRWTESAETSLSARLLHGTTDQADKFKRFMVRDSIRDYLARSAAAPQPDLVIWPESSIAFALHDVFYLLYEPALALQEQGTQILLGAYLDGPAGMLNVLVQATDPDRFYAKRHLVPYGEFTPDIPGLDFSDFLPDLSMSDLAAGAPVQDLLTAQGVPLAATICFENLFGHEQRHDWQQAQFLVQVSDLAWFVHTWAAEQLLQVSQMRAREAAKPVLQATNHGVSAVIDAQGRIMQRTVSEQLDAHLVPRTGTTPYTDYGDLPLGLVLLVCLGLITRRRA